MSFVAFDIIEIVEALLNDEGWRRAALQPRRNPIPALDRQARIYERGEDVAVICRPLATYGGFGRVRGGRIPSMAELADALDRYLRDLAEILKRIRKAYSGRFVLVFKRGGLPVPEWFLVLCQELGIRLEFLEDTTEALGELRSWAGHPADPGLEEERLL